MSENACEMVSRWTQLHSMQMTSEFKLGRKELFSSINSESAENLLHSRCHQITEINRINVHFKWLSRNSIQRRRSRMTSVCADLFFFLSFFLFYIATIKLKTYTRVLFSCSCGPLTGIRLSISSGSKAFRFRRRSQ